MSSWGGGRNKYTDFIYITKLQKFYKRERRKKEEEGGRECMVGV